MASHTPVTNANGERVLPWTPEDYLRVVCAMIPLQNKGMHRRDAMDIAQRLLPANKQRPVAKLTRNLVAEQYVKAREIAGKMTVAERAKLVAKLPAAQAAKVAKPPKAKRPPRAPKLPSVPREMMRTSDGKVRPAHPVRNTDTELALIARRVAHFQFDLKDTRPLSRLVKIAQVIELPPERHRTSGSIDAGLVRLRSELVRVNALRGLLADHPFDANRRTYVAPQAAEPTPPPAPVEAIPAAILPPIFHAATQEAPEPVPAPTPAPLPRSSLGDPIRAFGDAFASSMHTLLHAMTHEMMSELELRVSQMSERLMQRTVETISKGIGPLVHSALERELGGTVATPATEAEPMTLPDGAALPKALQLDVVGLIGHQVTEVRAQLNGYAAGMRFIDADHVDSWKPRETVILNTKFISHNADARCRKAGVKPIRVQGGAGAILNAIRTLCENEGISLPH